MSHYLEDHCRPESREIPPGELDFDKLCTPFGCTYRRSDGTLGMPSDNVYEVPPPVPYTVQRQLADKELQLAYAKLRAEQS